MATITNIVCTNNKEIDIQSLGGAINIGTKSSTNTVTIGNSTGTTGVNLNSGTGGTIFTGAVRTTPASSNTATTAFGTLTANTAKQNTLGYDIFISVSFAISSSTTATIIAGVNSTNTITTDTVVPSFSTATVIAITINLIVPNQYWVVVNTTGTITVTSITTVSCPI